MDESQVREIVARILADSRFQALVAGVSRNEAVLKPAALVVADSEAAVALLPELQERWDSCCSLQVFLGDSVDAAKVALPRRSFQEAMAEPSWSRLLIPVCSGSQLAEIAMGLRGTPLASLAAEAILRGIPVEIGRVDFAFAERTPAAYRKLFEEYAERVAAYGVTIGTKTVSPAAPTPTVVPPAPSAPAVVRDSGHPEGSPGLKLIGPVGEVTLDRGVIVAARHIHMHPDQAAAWGIRDGQRVRIRVESERPIVFDDVLVRVNPQFQGEVHLDTDEANAALVKTGATALILGV